METSLSKRTGIYSFGRVDLDSLTVTNSLFQVVNTPLNSRRNKGAQIADFKMDPNIVKLRELCLKRGATGIRGIRR